MDISSYIAASAGLKGFRELEIANHNVSNVGTAGYKKERMSGRMQSFEDTLQSTVEGDIRAGVKEFQGVVDVETHLDMRVGSINSTGNPMDVALGEPNHFFVTVNGEGQTVYTRAGNFTLNSNRSIVTAAGNQVITDGGAGLALPLGSVSFGEDGSILVDGAVAGRLQVVSLDPKELQLTEGGFVASTAGQVIEVPTVLTGSLEMANVSVVEGMVELISASRSFETYTKLAKTIDDVNEMTVTRIASKG